MGEEQDGKGSLSYISPGIHWSPNYLVKTNIEEKTLKIGGRATIISQIQFMDDITLPQLSLVSGMPNIACRGQRDPFVANDMNRQEQRMQTYMQRQQPVSFGSTAAPAGADPVVPEPDVGQDNFDEEKVGELYHFKMKNVPINYQKATSVPFMDDIVDIPYSETYSIKLDSTMANNEMVPAKHYFKFPLKFAPPLPRQVIIQKYWLLKILVM